MASLSGIRALMPPDKEGRTESVSRLNPNSFELTGLMQMQHGALRIYTWYLLIVIDGILTYYGLELADDNDSHSNDKRTFKLLSFCRDATMRTVPSRTFKYSTWKHQAERSIVKSQMLQRMAVLILSYTL